MADDAEVVASLYIATFAARSDVYSRWVVGQDSAAPIGWRPERHPLTPKIALAGLTGQGPAISGFMIAPGNTSHVLAIDFDTDDGMRQAGTLARFMDAEGLPAYVETSRRGAHLWCILDRPLPAVAIRHAERALLAAAGLPNDPKIELRPGSDVIGADGLGHALRLPLMPHPKTGQRGVLYTADGERLGRTLAEVVNGVDFAPAERIHPLWSERWQPVIDHLPREYRNPRVYPEEEGTASDILRDLWGVANAQPGRSVRCTAHDDRVASLTIAKDDQRVWCHSPSCILSNDGRGRGTHELRSLAVGSAELVGRRT